MAIGDVKFYANSKRSVCMVTAAAAIAVPALATDGVPNYPDPVRSVYGASDSGACYGAFSAKQSTVNVHSVGGATPTAKMNLWGYQTCSGIWYLIKNLNNGAAIAASSTGQIQYAEQIQNLGHYDRLALEINTASGLGTGLECWITTDRGVST